MSSEEKSRTKQIKASLKRAWQATIRRPLLKVSAVLLAIVVWAIVFGSDPTLLIEKTIQNAPVTVSGQEGLRSRGLIVMDDLTSGTITVKMRVQVRQSDFNNATATTINPRLDLSQITQAGTNQQIPITALPNIQAEVLSYDPPTVPINVENYITRSRIRLVVDQQGESSESLWVTNIVTEPSQVTVSGPESLVSQIQRAVVVLPMQGLSASRSSDNVSAALELQDADGNPISSPLLRITSDTINVDSINISLDVYPQKDVAVQKETATSGMPAHGYEVTDIRIQPEAVAIAARQEVLEEIEALYLVGPVDISGSSDSFSAEATLRIPSDINHIATTAVTIEVDIAPAEHVHVYNNLPVTMQGLGPNLGYELSHTEMDVLIRGAYDQVQGLKKDDITLYVNAADLTEGIYLLPVECIVNGTDAYTFEPEMATVTVTLTGSGETG